MLMLVFVFVAWGLLVAASHLAVYVAPLVVLVSWLANGRLRAKLIGWSVAALLIALTVLVLYYDVPIWHRITQARFERACRTDSGVALPDAPIQARGIALTYNVSSRWMVSPDWLGALVRDPLRHLSNDPYQDLAFVEVDGMRLLGHRTDHTQTRFDASRADVTIQIISPTRKGLQKFEILVVDRRNETPVARLHGYTYHGQSCPTRQAAMSFLASAVVAPPKPMSAPAPPLRELKAMRIEAHDEAAPDEKTSVSVSGPFEACRSLSIAPKKLSDRIEFYHRDGSRKIELHDDDGRLLEVADAACSGGMAYVLLRPRYVRPERTLLLHTYDDRGNLVDRGTISFGGIQESELSQVLKSMVQPQYMTANGGQVRFSLYERVNVYDRAHSVRFDFHGRFAVESNLPAND